MTITLEQPVHVTGATPAESGTRVVVFDYRLIDAYSIVTGSAGTGSTFAAESDAPLGPDWMEVLVAAEDTSLRFLEAEPDLYDDADGEPV